MGQKSTVELLPEHIGEEVNRLIREGATIDQIKARVAEMGGSASRSAIGRHTKKLKEVTERIRKSREVAHVLVEKFGKEPESKTARLNIELMHSIITDIVMQCADDGESDVVLDPGGAMFLAKALDHLAKAKKTDAETIRKAREEAMKDAAEAAGTTAKKKGLSPEAVKEIQESIMGIVKK